MRVRSLSISHEQNLVSKVFKQLLALCTVILQGSTDTDANIACGAARAEKVKSADRTGKRENIFL
jgi:hypothetical protein